MKKEICLYIVLFSLFLNAQKEKLSVLPKSVWVDSIYNSMSFEEKVGQLFMIAAYSNRDESHNQSLDKLIKEYKIGGLIFFQGGPYRQAKLTNRYQSKAKVPLLIGNDAEWGLSMRLDSTQRYPWNMTLGAIQDNKLIEKFGAQMAQQSKRLGVHFTFGPVVDINTNPNNPIIGNRSFGEDKENVTAKALAYMKGLQDNGVFATAKHFPGHGDTEVDSHYTLPTVNFDRKRIDEVELYPYKELIKNGLSSIMVAHLNIPSLENREGRPTSISYPVVTEILKNELKFEGLIFTDALNMKGASNFKQPGEIDLEAFLAGNDVLLFAEDVPKALLKFKEAYKNKLFDNSRLEHSVKKILNFKYDAKLNNYQSITLNNINGELNLPEYEALNFQLFEHAITVLKNENDLVPIKKLVNEKIAYVKIGDGSHEVFLNKLKDFATITEVSIDNIDNALKQLKNFTKVIIGYHKPDGAWKKSELNFREIYIIDKISKANDAILVFFSKPYSLLKIPNFDFTETIIEAFQNHDFAQTIASEIIFGSKSALGKLPVTIKEFKVKGGLKTKKINRLGYSMPELEGMNSEKLKQIDRIIEDGIASKAFPGSQILISKNGKIIFHKSFGHHTYDMQQEVKNKDVYDLASLTKILSTLPNIMKQYDKGAIKFDTTLAQLLPITEGTNKANATLIDMLSHQAKFAAWIPFYRTTLDSCKMPLENCYQKVPSENFPTKVADSLYLVKGYNEELLKEILNTELAPTKTYKYSDFTFILLKEYLEKLYNKNLDAISKENFYHSMGTNTMTYNPLEFFSSESIVPSENDDYFRHQLLKGYVHDMAAAMQGGIAGHAGLFANSLDVAKMMQMYIQKGSYGDEVYFSEQTFNDFNTCYFCIENNNRRGLGFDKPQLGSEGPTCGCVPKSSFGHTGFTGNITWADPDNNLVYVFLSNRTYPNANVNRLAKLNIRERIQKVIYDSIIPQNQNGNSL